MIADGRESMVGILSEVDREKGNKKKGTEVTLVSVSGWRVEPAGGWMCLFVYLFVCWVSDEWGVYVCV